MEQYPTRETLNEWDDASLLATVGSASTIRYLNHGFGDLNHGERALCCFNLLESCFNNGGAGHWVESICPDMAVATPKLLLMVGAEEMASFVADVLLPMKSQVEVSTKEDWVELYTSMPDEVHEAWETMLPRYGELEKQFLAFAYAFARNRWEEVRMA